MSNLTEQQTIIVRLVRSGLSNKQIARELGISEGTVKQHLNTIYDKLGIASRYTLIIGQSPNTKNVSATIGKLKACEGDAGFAKNLYERKSSGSLAMFATIRRASSLVRSSAADHRPWLALEMEAASPRKDRPLRGRGTFSGSPARRRAWHDYLISHVVL